MSGRGARPEHERAPAKRGKGNPLYPYVTAGRPRETDPERWVCYRSELCVATHEAAASGAPPAQREAIEAEYQVAVAYLRKHKPGLIEQLEGDTRTGYYAKPYIAGEQLALQGVG